MVGKKTTIVPTMVEMVDSMKTTYCLVEEKNTNGRANNTNYKGGL